MSEVAKALINAIKLTEIAVLDVKVDGHFDVSEESMNKIGVTMEDMYNLQQLRIKLENKYYENND